jgi:predicted DNA-binding transcriptional regulator AlpA
MNKLSTNEAAKYLGVSPSFLNKKRTTGGGPRYFKVGRRVVYDQADCDRWVAELGRSHTHDALPPRRPRTRIRHHVRAG